MARSTRGNPPIFARKGREWNRVGMPAMPGEGFEPPTFGLQNRCTTAVLTRPSEPPLSQMHRRDDGSLDGFAAVRLATTKGARGQVAQPQPRASLRTEVEALRFPSPA